MFSQIVLSVFLASFIQVGIFNVAVHGQPLPMFGVGFGFKTSGSFHIGRGPKYATGATTLTTAGAAAYGAANFAPAGVGFGTTALNYADSIASSVGNRFASTASNVYNSIGNRISNIRGAFTGSGVGAGYGVYGSGVGGAYGYTGYGVSGSGVGVGYGYNAYNVGSGAGAGYAYNAGYGTGSGAVAYGATSYTRGMSNYNSYGSSHSSGCVGYSCTTTTVCTTTYCYY